MITYSRSKEKGKMARALYLFNIIFVLPLFSFCSIDLKGDIVELQTKMDFLKEEEKKNCGIQLAKAYLADQDLKKSLETYLSVLPDENQASLPDWSEEESLLYREAWKIYQTNNGPDSTAANAQKLKEMLEPILILHPEYYRLNFLLSFAYANLGEYAQFMETFDKSCSRLPTHSLAFKGKAALYIKLFERSSSEEERNRLKHKIIDNVSKAIEKNSEDIGLYKWMILFSPESKKNEIIAQCLNKILEKPLVIQRADVAFFVQMAVEANQFNLGQQVIDKAGKIYQYSRVLLAAQEFLDREKKRRLNE